MIYRSLYTDFTSSDSGLLLSPPPLPCTVSFAQTFFFSCNGFFYNFYYPLSKSPHDLSRPSVISRRIGGSKPGRTLLPARERERKSPGGIWKFRVYFYFVQAYRALAEDKMPDDECRAACGKPHWSFTIIIKPPVHKRMEKSVCVRYLRARLSTRSYAPFALRIRKFYSGARLKPWNMCTVRMNVSQY